MANTTDRNKFNSPEETSNDADDAEDCPELDDDYFASIGGVKAIKFENLLFYNNYYFRTNI